MQLLYLLTQTKQNFDVTSNDERTRLQDEFRVIEKIWQKYDGYLTMRETLLTNTLAKYGALAAVRQQIDRLSDECNSRMQQVAFQLQNVANLIILLIR